MSKTANANDGDGDPFAGSSRGPLDPVAVPSSWSAKGIALQAAATVSTLAYLKLRYDTTFVKNGDGSKQQQQQQASPAAALLLAAEALAAFRALCHLGPFNLRTREQYRDAEELLAANSFEGCHMRILIPCYSESLDLVSTTAIAAAAADLPAGMERTIYLCDDGADPLKKKWCEDCDARRTLGCDVRWVSGRSKAVPGNGKSLNLNHALRSIYGARAVAEDCGRGVAAPGWQAAVPDTEFVAGLDADMAPSPAFFTELVSRLRKPRDAIAQASQAFWNYDAEADVTDNAQLVKYEICDAQVRALGGVRCNGSGWVCRARAMAHAGWWRVDVTGEGQAMGIALERLGYKGYYSMKTLQIGEVPCTVEDTFVQKTRYAQNFWKNVCGPKGILYDKTLSFGKRLTGQGLLRDSLTPFYIPVFVLAPVLALLFSFSSGAIIGWSPRLPLAWVVQYFLLQAVVLFNVAADAFKKKKEGGQHQKSTVRSLPASWLTNLTSTHCFWLMTAIAAYKVLQAELKGSLLEFVVTPKTQSAREQQAQELAAAPGASLTTAVSSSSAPTVAALPGVAASIAARPSLYPDEYFADGRRKSVLLPQATAAAAGLARRASVAFAGAASGFGGGGSGGGSGGAGGGIGIGSGRRASTVAPVMLEASIDRCQSLARVMLLHVQDEQARKKGGSQKSSSAAASSSAPAPAKKAPSPLRSSFGGFLGRQQSNSDGAPAAAAPAIKTPFRVDSPFNAADGAAAAATAAPAPVGPLSSSGTKGDGASKTIETLFSGGGASGDWRQLLSARRQAELQANAKKLRRWTSSLRIVRKPRETDGEDAAAAAVVDEEGEAVPWEHLWVHALAGGLSLLAFASGVCKLLLGWRAAKLPAAASSSSSSFFARRQAAAAPAAALLPAQELIVFTAWAFINAVPPVLLFVRTLRGDGPTLKRWCAVAPRAVFAVGGLALAGALAASA